MSIIDTIMDILKTVSDISGFIIIGAFAFIIITALIYIFVKDDSK